MCYSGRCLWEGHQGDCTFPSHIIRGRLYCNCTMQEYIDIKNAITRYKNIQQRKNKIFSIKNRLLDKTI
jgi:hypothetical protein